MGRVINDPTLVVEDMLRGWLAAHPDSLCRRSDNPRVVQRLQVPESGKVGVISGGGSGHEPAFLGYVGNGLLDAVAVGEIFSSPSARNFLDAMRSANAGAGVACLYGNYAGDNMNVKLAMKMAAREGIAVKTVVATDDVPSAPPAEAAKRRGVAGEILMWKVAAAKASMGGSLDQVIASAQKAMNATRSMGIGLSACIIPAVGKANFSIAPGTMEVGIGHHGEPGMEVRPVCSASDMAELMLNVVLSDLLFRPHQPGGHVAVLLSGLGATPLMEQYILYGEVAQRLQQRGLAVAFNRVGNLFSSLEMMGLTLTIMQLDEELENCLQYPCHSVGLSVAGGPSATSSPTSSAAHTSSTPKPTAITPAPSKAQTAIPHSPPHLPPQNPTHSPETPHPLNQRSMAGPTVQLASAGSLVRELISTIVAHRDYLSEIDGL
ncbi:MAG: dihydroxyacetone kinase subunit DhaK, partial [Rhodoferax sp.]|nr:dihydroxyacetone kinase subunit DhaK [Rhodoferax sp.]